MAFKSDAPDYTRIECPRCGKRDIVPSWKLNSMFMDRGITVREWSYTWFGARMRCSRCGTKGMALAAR